MSARSHMNPGLKPPSSRLAGGKSPRLSVGSDAGKKDAKDDKKLKEKDKEIESLKAHVSGLLSQLKSAGIEPATPPEAVKETKEKEKDTPTPTKRSISSTASSRSKITASGPTATPTVTLRSKLAKAEAENKRLNTRILELEGQMATAKKRSARSKSRPKARAVSPAASSTRRSMVQKSSTVRNLAGGGRSGALSARRPASARKSEVVGSRTIKKSPGTPKSERGSVSSVASAASTSAAGAGADDEDERSSTASGDGKESSAAVEQLAAKLRTAQAAIDEARQAELRLAQERDAAKAESEELKVELVNLAGQLKKQSMTGSSDELLKQIEDLQNQVLHYQQKVETQKRERRGSVFADQDGVDALKERVASLTTVLEAVQQENGTLKSAKAELQAKLEEAQRKLNAEPREAASDAQMVMIEKMGAELMEVRQEAEHYKAQVAELERQSRVKGQRFMTNRLNEQVTNLTYQMFYGASERDEEVDRLRARLHTYEDQSEQITRIKKKFDKMQKKQIEKWLLDDDAGEAL